MVHAHAQPHQRCDKSTSAKQAIDDADRQRQPASLENASGVFRLQVSDVNTTALEQQDSRVRTVLNDDAERANGVCTSRVSTKPRAGW